MKRWYRGLTQVQPPRSASYLQDNLARIRQVRDIPAMLIQ